MSSVKDYYEILNLQKDCTEKDIKKSYRRLAMKYHPDKNGTDEASKIFQDISEAYLVLSDNKKRQIYDQIGYEGLKEKMDDDEDVFKQTPQETFECFFGSRNPFAAFEFGNPQGACELPKKDGPTKGADKLYKLQCTLMELLSGCIKTFELKRKMQHSHDGPISEETKTLTIHIKPGWKKGTKIVFANEGDHMFGQLPSDVIFSLEEKSHMSFERDGNNLVYTHQLSLLDSLLGGSISIKTLDNRDISIACPEIVYPAYQKIIPGEGMPVAKSPGERGDLIVKFNIIFPKHLSLNKRQKLKEILSSDSKY